MFMKKCIFISLIVVSLMASSVAFGGRPVLQRSVFEKIEEDELARLFEVEPAFKETYEVFELIPKLIVEEKRLKYQGITWGDIYKFQQYRDRILSDKEILRKWKEEWSIQYSRYDREFDSVLTFWARYVGEISFNDTLEFPVSMANYLGNLLTEDADYYREMAIKDLLYPEYIGVTHYAHDKWIELAQQNFPMEYMLIMEYTQISNFIIELMESESGSEDSDVE